MPTGNYEALRFLLEIREAGEEGMSLEQLSAGTADHSGHSVRILRVLKPLLTAGLIKEAPAKDFEPPRRRKFTATERLQEIQEALGLSLNEMIRTSEWDSINVQPIFCRFANGKNSAGMAVPDVSVLMPFTDALKPVYDDHIKQTCKELGLSVGRADDFFASREIMQDIWKLVSDSKLIIADCTGRNPNVFYELGISHTVGKQVILITQSPEDIPFDLRHIRYLRYAYTPRGMTLFEIALAEAIKEHLDM